MQYTSDEAYSRLISHHMTVPQRIKATGDIVDEDSAPNGVLSGWDYANEKFDMKVPERILVMGQDQHVVQVPMDIITEYTDEVNTT